MHSLRCIFFYSLFSFAIIPELRAQKQDRELLIYNTALGGVTAGIGAVINKEKTDNWKTAFAKGFWQGSIGGTLNYASKKTLYLVNKKQELAYAWPSNILQAAGNSIIENAAFRRPFLRHWNIDLWLVMLDFSTASIDDVRIRFLPSTLYSIPMASYRSVFDFPTTFLTGQLAFRSKDAFIQMWGGSYLGFSYGRAFHYVNNSEKYQTITHEIIHNYQFRQYQVLNAWFSKPAKKASGPRLRKLFSDYVYPDAPYFDGIYLLEGYHDFTHYYRNYFELEAERFATNRDVLVR